MGVIPVLAVNYLVGAVLCFGILVVYWPGVYRLGEWQAAGLGALNGLLYFLHLLLILAAYRLAGIAVTSAMVALGVIIAVLASWYVWSEPMNILKWIAVALLPVTVILVRPCNTTSGRLTLNGDAVLLLVFTIGGIVQTVHKSFNMYACPASLPLYQAALFTTAMISSLTYVCYRSHKIGGRITALGSVLGAFNVLVTVFIVLGLAAMPAVVFYTMSTSLVIVLSAIVSWVLWGERISRRQILGLLSAICIVVLVNL